MSQWEAFEEDPAFVRQEILRGNLDWLEVVDWQPETEFFRYLLGEGNLQELAESYPSPRRRHLVPLWVYLCSVVSLRLHGALGFGGYPYVVHAGGLKEALEPGQLEWKRDPKSGQSYLDFAGYNDRNSYARRAPCDKDYLRKMARATDAQDLMGWLGSGVAKWYKEVGAYDREGLFVVDGSYLFVPDNDRYEDSSVLRFDKHNHPVDSKKLTAEQLRQTRLRRCYRMVDLIHVNRAQTLRIYTGVKIGPGKMAESPELLPMVERFMGAVGRGVMKKLIHDRGFTDGKTTATLKLRYGIDSVLAFKKTMHVYQEAWALAEADGKPWHIWWPVEVKRPEPPQRPEGIRRQEAKRQETLGRLRQQGKIPERVRTLRVEMKRIPEIRIWDACEVPIDAVACRKYLSNGKVYEFVLGTTERGEHPEAVWNDYGVRQEVEEGHRQSYCFWDMTAFRSPRFALVVNQVVMTLLAQSLFQVWLHKTEQEELSRMSRDRVWEMLLPQGRRIAAYVKNRVAFVDALEYSGWLVAVEDGARRRLVGQLRRIARQRLQPPELPTRP